MRPTMQVLAFALLVNVSSGFVYFMPGDAFFHTTLSSKRIDRHPQFTEQTCTIGYMSPPSVEGRFEESIGFPGLLITKCDAGFRDRVLQTFRQCNDGNPDDDVHVFVYNKDFELNRAFVGLKYNEQWGEDVKFEAPFRAPIMGPLPIYRYESFSQSRDMVLFDWRDASRVAGLHVVVPDGVEWRKIGRPQNVKAVEIKASQCMLLFVARQNLDAVVERKVGAKCWQLLDKNTNELIRRENQWEVVGK